jgi:hypothetical protein
MGLLAVSDLRDIEGEPRIQDLRLAEALGFERPRAIRQLIERNIAELERYGPSPHRVAMVEIGSGAEREVQEYWLNERQAVIICMASRTPAAENIREEIVNIFVTFRTRRTAPATTSVFDQLLDEKLLPIRGDLNECKTDIKEIKGNVVFLRKHSAEMADRINDIVPRREFSKETKQKWCRLVAREYHCKCPRCRKEKIVTETADPIAGELHYDHFVGREQNAIDKGWPTCKRCNLRSGHDQSFKEDGRSRFDVFQLDLKAMLDAECPEKRIAKGKKPGPHPGQLHLFDDGRGQS